MKKRFFNSYFISLYCFSFTYIIAQDSVIVNAIVRQSAEHPIVKFELELFENVIWYSNKYNATNFKIKYIRTTGRQTIRNLVLQQKLNEYSVAIAGVTIGDPKDFVFSYPYFPIKLSLIKRKGAKIQMNSDVPLKLHILINPIMKILLTLFQKYTLSMFIQI